MADRIVQPGWYPDPGSPKSLIRWWDGSQWSDNVQPKGSAPVETDNGKLITWAWVGTLLFAPVGLVLGIKLIGRGERGHGWTTTILSGALVAWLIVIVIGALSESVSTTDLSTMQYDIGRDLETQLRAEMPNADVRSVECVEKDGGARCFANVTVPALGGRERIGIEVTGDEYDYIWEVR